MIIVKTDTGDTFLNEKHCFYVEYIKKEKKVKGKRIGADFYISGVESVRYVSDASRLADIKHIIKNRIVWENRLYNS